MKRDKDGFPEQFVLLARDAAAFEREVERVREMKRQKKDLGHPRSSRAKALSLSVVTSQRDQKRGAA
jgi:hypothetical protein